MVIAIIIALLIIIFYLSYKLFSINNTIDELIPPTNPRAELLRQLNNDDILKPRTFDQYRKEVDGLIERVCDIGDFGKNTKLADACKKGLTDGKRVRAIILMEINRATLLNTKIKPIDVADLALMIEYLHNASLIVDDLPEFDNDKIRRGKPSIHAEFGPAIAQMAALCLIAGAFQNICRQIDWMRTNCHDIKNIDVIATKLCGEISRALGTAACGQYMDISENPYNEFGDDAIAEMTYMKTATFFEIATVTGWLAGNGDFDKLSTLRLLGCLIGTAFQIADDIGDFDRDKQADRWNFAIKYGREVAFSELYTNLSDAATILNQLQLWTPLWEEIFEKILGMTK